MSGPEFGPIPAFWTTTARERSGRAIRCRALGRDGGGDAHSQAPANHRRSTTTTREQQIPPRLPLTGHSYRAGPTLPIQAVATSRTRHPGAHLPATESRRHRRPCDRPSGVAASGTSTRDAAAPFRRWAAPRGEDRCFRSPVDRARTAGTPLTSARPPSSPGPSWQLLSSPRLSAEQASPALLLRSGVGRALPPAWRSLPA